MPTTLDFSTGASTALWEVWHSRALVGGPGTGECAARELLGVEPHGVLLRVNLVDRQGTLDLKIEWMAVNSSDNAQRGSVGGGLGKIPKRYSNAPLQTQNHFQSLTCT